MNLLSALLLTVALGGAPPYYWVVYGYSYNAPIVAGPFDDDNGPGSAYNLCEATAQAYNRSENSYLYRCVLK